jgi:hypothetical protein
LISQTLNPIPNVQTTKEENPRLNGLPLLESQILHRPPVNLDLLLILPPAPEIFNMVLEGDVEVEGGTSLQEAGA